MMVHAVGVRWAARAAALVTLVAGGLGACSLGDGVTPECVPSDDPSLDTACHQVSACDDGNGFVKPTPECCEVAAEREYGLCAQTNDTGNARETCTNSPDQPCCNVLLQEFDACLANPTGGGQGG